MDTAGKAVLFSGDHGADLADRGDARPIAGVPLDEPRDHARGHLRARGDADAAAGGARRGSARRSTSSRCRGRTPASTAPRGSRAWGERLWRQPVRYGVVALAILIGLALPVTQLKTAMPSIKVVPTSDASRIGYNQVQAAFGPGATGPLQIVTPAAQASARRADREPRPRGGGADADADQRRLRADHRDPQAGPVQPGRRPHDRPAPGGAARRRR